MSGEGKRAQARAQSFIFHGKTTCRVYKNTQTGYWFAAYEDENGKRIRKSLRVTSRPEAELAVRKLWAEAKPDQEESSLDLTIRDAVSRYLEHCRNKGLAPRTLDRYSAALEAMLRHCGNSGAYVLSELNLALLEGFTAFRQKRDKASPVTAYNDTLTIKGFCKYLAHPARRMLAVNPALGWDVREAVRKEPYCYTQDEVGRIKVGVRDWLRPVVTVLANAGMRIGELINLRWEDINEAKGVIHIRAREGWQPKGRRNRIVPMHPEIRNILPQDRSTPYVFMGPRGGKLKETYCLHCFKADRKKLGIQNGTLHTFRHFFVSLCAARGVPMATCMSWVGHRDMDTVWRYYHLHDSESQRAMQLLVEA
jgi:integrase